MKILATAALVSFVLGLVGCATTGTTHPELDVRTRVFSPDGTAFVECKGPDGCSDDVMKMIAEMPTPTEAELDAFREEWIHKLAHPKTLAPECDQLPTIPWESWTIEDGGPSCDLPGYVMIGDSPDWWSKAEKARRPQIRDEDKPIGKLQQGDSVWLVYRVRETGDLVTCSIMSGGDIPEDTCDVKYRTPKDHCTYSQTILKGH